MPERLSLQTGKFIATALRRAIRESSEIKEATANIVLTDANDNIMVVFIGKSGNVEISHNSQVIGAYANFDDGN
ncbi:MAG TPA: hypothetical protein VFK94_05230 [Patescibacteria group bacterium]|nr:hypothetical protein [Patescibacteria group bacterium]